MSDSDQQAQNLFNQPQKDEEANPFDQDEPSEKQQRLSPKRQKKHKRDKHNKHKRRHLQRQYDDEEQEDDADDDGMGGLFEDQASEGSDEQEDYDDGDDLNGHERREAEQLYRRKGPSASEALMGGLKNMSDKQVQNFYRRKLHQRRQNEVLIPSAQDHKTYTVNVKMGKQEEMVFAILKKAQHYRKTKNPKYKVQITSAMALKKKYPGKIFVEAANEKIIRESFDGFIDANLGKIVPLQHQQYTNLFVVKDTEQAQFKKGAYIRIKKGVYEDDLGKIIKLNKNSADVLLVPRINIQELSIKIKEQVSKISDEKMIYERKQELLKKFLNPRTYYPSHLRPAKKLFENENPFAEFNDVPYTQKIRIQKGGLILLNFRLDELKKLQGSILPIQAQPFAADGRLFQDMKEEKILTGINFTKGQEAEIIAGELSGYFGTVEQIKENTAVIKCRTKGMQGRMLEQPLDHLSKRFKQGQRVKVTSGTDKGKTGIILKLEGKHAQIWTDNENMIKINKNNLQVNMGEIINQENLHNLKKDDLIKTTKNLIGIVLSTTKDNIKILDMNNTIQIINNLDFDSKVNSSLLLTKNKNNEQIRNNSMVRIRQGQLQGMRCLVKHVYKDYVFLFNETLDKTSGMSVQKADNCAVLAKTTQGPSKKFGASQNNNRPSNSANDRQPQAQQDQRFKIGKSIVISSGPLKGYRGVIKSINKERIEVRVPQKSCTEWITAGNLAAVNRDTSDMGKTPKRVGMSTYQQPPAMSPNSFN